MDGNNDTEWYETTDCAILETSALYKPLDLIEQPDQSHLAVSNTNNNNDNDNDNDNDNYNTIQLDANFHRIKREDNIRLQNLSRSTPDVKVQNRPVAFFTSFAFLLAFVAFTLAAVCSWLWYDWVWFLAVPAFIFGACGLTYNGKENEKMAYIFGLFSFVLSIAAIVWASTAIALCKHMCTCAYWSKKTSIYHEMLYRLDKHDLGVCTYVTYPPLPVEKNQTEDAECFPDPITLAFYGLSKGYQARICEKPPRDICTVTNWYRMMRLEEDANKWAWFGKPIFKGYKNKKRMESCKRHTDCAGYPKIKCYGYEVENSVCLESGVALGNSCFFDRQCSLGKKEHMCKLPEKCKATSEFICKRNICKERQNCPRPKKDKRPKKESPESRGTHHCTPECSCCNGCSNHGQCVKAGKGWECECGYGSYGPNCKWNENSGDSPGGNSSEVGMCKYMSTLCANGSKCKANSQNILGFQCECPKGFHGPYCNKTGEPKPPVPIDKTTSDALSLLCSIGLVFSFQCLWI